MRSNKESQGWAHYAKVTDHNMIEAKDGCCLRWRYPCGSTASISFATRSDCMRHLRKPSMTYATTRGTPCIPTTTRSLITA